MTTIAVHVHIDSSGRLAVSGTVPPECRGVSTDGLLVLDGPTSVSPATSGSLLEQRRAALDELARAGGLGRVVPNPSDWQREQRRDRALPGRE